MRRCGCGGKFRGAPDAPRRALIAGGQDRAGFRVLQLLPEYITIIRGRQGHSDVRMTERYVHDTVKVQKPAVARLNRALARKLPSHSPTH